MKKSQVLMEGYFLGLRRAAQVLESVLQEEWEECVDPEFIQAVINNMANFCVEKYHKNERNLDENGIIAKHLMPELLSFKHRLSNEQVSFDELKRVALYRGRINSQQLRLFAELKDHGLMHDAELFINNLHDAKLPKLDPYEF